MKYYTSFSGYTPLQSAPAKSAAKVNGININPNTVLLATGQLQREQSTGINWRQVQYTDTKNKDWIGWVDDLKISPYRENFPQNCVDMSNIQTTSEVDAQQYVTWENKTQYNYCGQISCSYLFGVRLSDFLTTWKQKDINSYKRIHGSDMVADGTSDADLIGFFTMYGKQAKKLSGNISTYTPETLERMTGAIVSVHINNATGRLEGDGTLHWVVVTKAIDERTGYGLVEIYNPFPNRIEVYSYKEFIVSARSPYGVISI